jgi:hypothetical protein
VHYYEFNTEDLVSIDAACLTMDEAFVLFDVLMDRRDEINDMIEALTKIPGSKKVYKVPVPADVIGKLRANLTDSDSMIN